MEYKKQRSIKVCENSGFGVTPAPTIRLQGKWLECCGFCVNDKVDVLCEEGKLVITKSLLD